MTEPRRKVAERINELRVVCRRCGATPWEGQQLPTGDGSQLLADFADAACPIGGTAAGCPSTSDAQATEQEAQPLTRLARLRAIVDQLVTAIQTNRDDIRTVRQQGTALAARVTALEQDTADLKAQIAALTNGG